MPSMNLSSRVRGLLMMMMMMASSSAGEDMMSVCAYLLCLAPSSKVKDGRRADHTPIFFGSLKPPWRHLSYNEPNCQAMVACILVQLVICDGFGLYKVQPPSGVNYCDILT